MGELAYQILKFFRPIQILVIGMRGPKHENKGKLVKMIFVVHVLSDNSGVTAKVTPASMQAKCNLKI